MKKIFFFPRFTTITLALMLTASVVVISEMGCASSKPGCGNKHQHRARAKKVRRMAPSMGG